MIERKKYLDFLLRWRDKDLIKVVSGVRRCGKSTLFEIYKQELLKNSVNKKQIISINFEDPENEKYCDYMTLYEYVKSQMVSDKKNYIFLDEIQHVKEFEKAVDGLYILPNADVYITGSNAYFMSSELATLLSGRYVELKMLPLSFQEFASTQQTDMNIEKMYEKYITNSSFPYASKLDNEEVPAYLDGLLNTIVLKDIIGRNKITNKIVFEKVLKFMCDNIGNPTSLKSIVNTLKNNKIDISYHTIENYVNGITDSMLMEKVNRYDIKGKALLQFSEKYYLVDVALKKFLLGNQNIDKGRVLENVVYLELKRRGYKVFVGKVDSLEVDFVCQTPEGYTEYYQVAYSVKDDATLKRELLPFEKIKDHNQKFLLTMDYDNSVYNGIKQYNVLEWLLGKE